MQLLRLLIGLPLVVALGFGITYLITRNPRWIRLGIKLTTWSVAAALVFLFGLFVQQFL